MHNFFLAYENEIFDQFKIKSLKPNKTKQFDLSYLNWRNGKTKNRKLELYFSYSMVVKLVVYSLLCD